MSKNRKCPDCDMVLNEGAHACGCGWREPGHKTVAYPLGYRQCDWRATERCRFPASLSTATDGSGPWYCSAHHACSSGFMGDDIVQASRSYKHAVDTDLQARSVQFCKSLGLQNRIAMVEWVKHCPKHKPGIGWAIAAMEKVRAGQSVPFRTEELARQALGLPEIGKDPPNIVREPGEDLEELPA